MPIIPRWEWRTFGDRFGRANAAFAALKRTGVQDSDELYLLSGGGGNSAANPNSSVNEVEAPASRSQPSSPGRRGSKGNPSDLLGRA